MATTCFDAFDKIIKNVRIFAYLCGADIFNPNYKINAWTWVVITAINVFFGCNIYTIYVGLVIDGDWKIMLQCLSLAGSGVQGSAKLFVCIYHRVIINDILEHLSNIYKEYQEEDQCYKRVLKYRTDLATKVLKIDLLIYLIGSLIILTFPFIYGVVYGEKLFIMQFLIPGVDRNTNTGYMILNSVQIFFFCLGAFGNFAGDMFMFVFIINTPLLKDILKLKCQKLSEVALRTHDPKQTVPMLKDIVECHQYYNKFILQVESVYFGVIFIQIFTAVMSICCTLFSIVIRSWPAGFAYFIYGMVTLYAYCWLGNLVEVSNEEVGKVIYSECLWYELTVPEQKLILLMLRKSQAPRNLTIGKIMPLSMGTALQLTKAIYSFMMMLMNFLDGADEK